MPANTYSITLSNDEQAYLKLLFKLILCLRSSCVNFRGWSIRMIQAQVVDCAHMLLWKSEAKLDKTIADNFSVTVNTVRSCITHYNSSGINIALFDDEHTGRPLEIKDDVKVWIINVDGQKSCELGYAAEL